MEKHEFFAALDARKPQFDVLIADEGVVNARRFLWGYIEASARAAGIDVSTSMADFSQWWDRNYSEVN